MSPKFCSTILEILPYKNFFIYKYTTLITFFPKRFSCLQLYFIFHGRKDHRRFIIWARRLIIQVLVFEPWTSWILISVDKKKHHPAKKFILKMVCPQSLPTCWSGSPMLYLPLIPNTGLEPSTTHEYPAIEFFFSWVTQKLPQICTVIFRICIGRLRDLQYILAVTSGSTSIWF